MVIISSLRLVETPFEGRNTAVVMSAIRMVGRIFFPLKASRSWLAASWMGWDHLMRWSNHQLLPERLFSKQSAWPLLIGPRTMESAP